MNSYDKYRDVSGFTVDGLGHKMSSKEIKQQKSKVMFEWQVD